MDKNMSAMPEKGKTYSGEPVMTEFPEGTNWEYYSDYLDDYRFEYENSDGLLEFQEWVALEHFFGQRISKRTYESLAQYYNEDETVNGEILGLGDDDPLIEAFRVGDNVVFTLGNGRISYRCTILRLEESEKYPLYEIGPVYIVRTEDGCEKHALYWTLSRQETDKAPESGDPDEDEKFVDMCYGAYKLDWMLSHGYSLSDIKEVITELAGQAVEDGVLPAPESGEEVIALGDSLTDDFLDAGFGSGSLYVCKNEFLSAEFLDEGYMSHLFSVMHNSETNMEKWRRITGIRKKPEPEVCLMMTISTAHITPETSGLLDADISEKLSAICVYPKIGMPAGMIHKASSSEIREADYGWWIHIPQDSVSEDLYELRSLPEDLLACIRYAKGHGCTWLCLDAAGSEVDELPLYEW